MATQPPRHNNHTAPEHEVPAALRAVGIVVGLAVALALVAIAFALPAAKSKPHNVPIGAVGTQPASVQVANMVQQNAPDAFAVSLYPDEAALRSAIRDRNLYGGFASGPDGPTLLIATGGSPSIAQLLTQIGNGISQHAGVPVRVEDLAPPTAGDPRGAGLAASALPMTLAGLLPAIALSLLLRREVWTRFGATVVFAVLAGITIAAVLRYVLGSIDQNLWGVAGGLTLGALAAGLPVLGLSSLFGRLGLIVGALLSLLVGNPLAGLSSAPQMLPSGWGDFGQLMPQGANATLLRSTAFFHGAGAGSAIAVLASWAVAGTVLVGIAAFRRREYNQPAWDLRIETRSADCAPPSTPIPVPTNSSEASTPAGSPSTQAPATFFRPTWAGNGPPSPMRSRGSWAS
jgi:hypothetical protein